MTRGQIVIACAVYVAGLLLTTGYETVRFELSARSDFQRDGAFLPGLFVGMIWPVYWPFRLSYLAFAAE